MGKLFESKSQEIQDILRDEYEKISTSRNLNIEGREIDPKDLYEEEVSKQILASYNSKYQTDFQKELRAYLNPTVMEKIRASIDGQDIDEIKKQEQEEIGKTIDEASADGIGVDSSTKKNIEKNIEEKKKNEKGQGEVNIRAEVLKAIYKSVLEDYYRLQLSIQEEGPNSQLKTGDISVGDKNGTKLVLYERYLKNIDKSYKGIEKYSIIRDDEDIKKFEEGLAYRAGRNEKAILEKNDKNIDRAQEIYKERDAIAEEIAYLANNAAIMNSDKFKSQMDELQKRYMNESAKLYNIEPNPLELQKSIEEREQNDRFREKQVGSSYEIMHERQLGSKVAVQEKQNDISLEENIEEQNEQVKASDEITNASAQEVLNRYYEAEERGDYKKAEELLQSLEEMADIKYADVNTTKTEEQEQKTPDEKATDERKDNILHDERLNAVNEEDEVAKIEAQRDDRKARAKVAAEKLNVKRNTTQPDRSVEHQRSMYNRKANNIWG